MKTAWVVLEDGKIKQERTPALPAPELELEIGCGNSLEIFNQIAYAAGEETGRAELCPPGTNRADFRVRIGRKDLFRNDKLFEGGLELMRAAEEAGTEEGILSAVFRMGGREIEEAWNFSYHVFAKTAGGHMDETE